MDDRSLDDALEPGRWLGILVAVAHQVLELAFEIGREAASKLIEVHVACPHDRGSILVIKQREQQMLQRGIFVVPLIGQRQGAVQGLFKVARKRRHVSSRANVLYGSGVPAASW